jgi:hypothetical protein
MGHESKQRVRDDLMTYAEISRHLAETKLPENDWAGLPVPVAGLNLVLEPRFKHKALENFRWKECYDEDGVRHALDEEPTPVPSEFRRVNSWWNAKYQVAVVVVQDKQGRAHGRIMFQDKSSLTLRTLQAAAVWPVEAEQKAQKRLAELISAEMFELYVLTGHFTEESRRSKVTYLFRRGRPTVAMREEGDSYFTLCALCLHPIGYYGDTWAGVMCPTDEVIAHLLMMRGSEQKFWANANQHSLDHPTAGL